MSGKNRKDFAKMAEQNEYIKEAYECLEKMSADERKRREYEERQKILWDHNSFMKSAKIIGMREGRKDVLTIQRIYDIANTYAPEYDIEKIVQKLENTSGMKQK